jgi:NADH-quinone oxidoreductase subunit N
MNPQIYQDLQRFYPEIAITAAFLIAIIVDLTAPGIRKIGAFAVTALGLGTAFLLSLPLFAVPAATLFFGMVALDPVAVFFKCFLIFSSLLVLCAAPASREFNKSHLGEFYALLLGVTLGMLLLASAADLLMLYLALEMVSIGSYIMVGYLRNERESNEASLKYLLFGVVSTGSMLYGISLLFGLTGTTKIAEIRQFLTASGADSGTSMMLLVSTVLILAGFGFKTASVPFHFWCPDVYTGAPTPVTAFLSVGPKAAGFAALIRFFFSGLSDAGDPASVWAPVAAVNWTILILLLSVITMTFGNIAALRQENMKRLLAYSSIAHAGYMLMGAVVLSAEGIQSVLIYLITYLFMNLGAFFIVIEVFNRTGSFELRDYRGLYRRAPFMTIAMSIFMLSLMGIPPFAGFFGKLFVFAAAVNHHLVWFAVIGALNSVIAVYYYARVIKTMIIDEGQERTRLPLSPVGAALVWLMLLPTAGLMLFWDRVQQLTRDSVRLFFGS